jgi:hypothetical protein
MSAASSSSSLQIIDEDNNDDNPNADANLTGPSIITQCLSPSSPNLTNTNNEMMSSEETPIPEDLEQLTIPFYGLADSAPFLGQLQSILNSYQEEQKLDKTLTIEVLLSVAYRLLTAVGLSLSPNRQPNLPHDDDFPGTIVQPLMSHQGFGGGGGSDPDDSDDEGFNSDDDDEDDDESSPDNDEEVKKKNLRIKQKKEQWKIWKCSHRAIEFSLEILTSTIHCLKSHHLEHANQARTHAQWYKDMLKGKIQLPVSNLSL